MTQDSCIKRSALLLEESRLKKEINNKTNGIMAEGRDKYIEKNRKVLIFLCVTIRISFTTKKIKKTRSFFLY